MAGYATHVSDIPNAFKPKAVEINELGKYYYDGTMEFRTGSKFDSPIANIMEACQMPSESNTFMLLGHHGCGKSTELNFMSSKLLELNYSVSTIHCDIDIDLFNPVYSDLLILIGERLLKIANENKCKLDDNIIEAFSSFWTTEITNTRDISQSAGAEAGAHIQAKTPSMFSGILEFMAYVKTNIRYNSENRTQYRNVVSNRPSEWLDILKNIAMKIIIHLNNTHPIIIFEDLDKIKNMDKAFEMFSNYASILSGMPFPVIYTCPIELAYNPRFTALEGYYNIEFLPMIKIKNKNGTQNNNGYNAIENIIRKRAELSLFGEGVLKKLITKTGGSLRDLFYCINTAAKIAVRRKQSDMIVMEDAGIALDDLKSSLTRRIDGKDYKFLSDIYSSNKESIEDKVKLLEMMNANAVLEYNTERWHNIHPLIADFLAGQGLITLNED